MKKLIHEIHRRSLWQVLGIYLAVSWIVLQVVDVIGANFGLPDWVAPAALVILLLGLPVVIATAFLQEGMTTKASEAPPQSLADAGEVEPPPAPEPSGRHTLFTWRNALIGGGAAFALLGIMTAGYLFMRTAGIGPAGTLVAQGVLEEGARVVLADFESDDPGLGAVVTGALRIDLLQSPTIRIVEESELSSALARMAREADAPVTGAIARELVTREGWGAAIDGEIRPAGSGYVLTARILAGDEWTALAAFRETARGEDDLIDAIEALSRKIRDKSGESLRTVQNAPPLRQVTTGSLEALRLYTRAEDLENTDRAGATALFESAIEIDPDFAMAHRKVGVNLSNMGIRRADQIVALTRAFELRDRVPPAERHLAEAYYYGAVVGDRQAAIRAYERLLDGDPDNRAGLNNLSVLYQGVGRLEEAEVLVEHALSLEDFTVAFANLFRTRFDLGGLEEAEPVIDRALDRLPEGGFRFEDWRVQLMIAGGDYSSAEAATAGYLERYPTAEGRGRAAYQRAYIHGIRGELRAAEENLRDVRNFDSYRANPMSVARDRAMLALVRGDSAGAVRAALDAYEAHRDTLPVEDLAYDWWIPTLIEAGATSRAQTFYEEWLRGVPNDQLGVVPRDAVRELEARFAMARGEPAEALRLWDAFEHECPGGWCTLLAAISRARIHDAEGEVAAAIAGYERFLEIRYFDRALLDIAYRGAVLERLAQLYDGRGEARQAVRYYAMFAELWDGADEELQPRVTAARARLAELEEPTR